MQHNNIIRQISESLLTFFFLNLWKYVKSHIIAFIVLFIMTFDFIFETFWTLQILQDFFLSPGHDRVVTIKSRNFSIARVCCLGFYWSTRGSNMAAHSSIHASFILRRGLTRFQLPKGFLDLRIVECRNSWYTGNITLIAPNHF